MSPIVLLIIVAIFQGIGSKPPEIQGYKFDTMEHCQQVGLEAKTRLEKDDKIKAIEFKCIEFNPDQQKI